MAGIYIHTPFCKTRCNYCDFYSTTQSHLSENYADAVVRELKLRKDYLGNKVIETIYFGGGTPSQLTIKELSTIFNAIVANYKLSPSMEITLEANPDDLNRGYFLDLKQLPINRLSIGIQTFNDILLKKLNRRHNSKQAKTAVLQARDFGYDNLSIDLMYGLPGESLELWENDLYEATLLDPEHISAYHLIYEKGTKLYKYLKEGIVKEVDEEISLQFFKKLIDYLTESNYEHYEISNFAKKRKYAKHNTSYWLGEPYLGCGPSAHSYNIQSRDYNNITLEKYINNMSNNKLCTTTETLDLYTRYNDYIITRLRTMWGIKLNNIKEVFGNKLHDYALCMSKKHINNGDLILDKDHLKLSKQGIFISDGIMSDLLYV